MATSLGFFGDTMKSCDFRYSPFNDEGDGDAKAREHSSPGRSKATVIRGLTGYLIVSFERISNFNFSSNVHIEFWL